MMSIIQQQKLRWPATFLATLLTINLPLPGAVQASLLLGLWGVVFWPIHWSELVLFLGVNVLYVVGDMGAISRGVFTFSRPDLAGLPYWEFGMWGFFVLLLHRWRGPIAHHPQLRVRPFILMAGMMAVFQISDPWQLTIACYALFGLMLGFDHTRFVLISVGWMVAMGTVLEYTCVMTGIWSYPPEYLGGVGYWYGALFGATGYFYETGVRPLYDKLAGSRPC